MYRNNAASIREWLESSVNDITILTKKTKHPQNSLEKKDSRG